MAYKFTSIAPQKHLNSVVKNFFLIEFDKDTSRTDYLLPDGLPSFFYIQSSEPVVTHFGEKTITLRDGFYVGYTDTIVELTHKRLKITGASVFPVYFSMIFDKRPLSIINSFSPLEETDALKPLTFLLTSPENDFREIAGLFEKYITDQLNKHQLNHDFLLVCEKLIHPGSYHLTVEELAEGLGCSTRYLHSRFRQVFGMSPKKFIRLVRFNRALKCIYAREGDRSLSSIAHEAGYHDQSHFIRDFKSICGKTPKEIFGNSTAMANRFCLF